MKQFKSQILNDYFIEAERKVINELATKGNEFINTAYNTKAWRNRTFNLHDSFGYAVYENGVLKKCDYLGSAEATEENKGQSGRTSIIEYFNGYKSKVLFELVIAVTMKYAKSLEQGKTPTHKVYQVISQVFSDMSTLSGEIKGSKFKTIGI